MGLLDKCLHQSLVLFAALLDEAGGWRYFELPHLGYLLQMLEAHFLYPDDDKAGGTQQVGVKGSLTVVVVLHQQLDALPDNTRMVFTASDRQ